MHKTEMEQINVLIRDFLLQMFFLRKVEFDCANFRVVSIYFYCTGKGINKIITMYMLIDVINIVIT